MIDAEPPSGCALCPRLTDFRSSWRCHEPGWHNAPVPTWTPDDGDGAVKLLIVGLAPGLRGGNRTGRPFYGDASGELLFASLMRHGLARDADGHLELVGTAITNAVRCVPPQNRPLAAEVNTCRRFLEATIAQLDQLAIIMTLGKIAHESTIRALGGRIGAHPFRHGVQYKLAGLTVIASYHCSRYNVNTGRLTEAMFDDVLAKAAAYVQA